jgi:ribosomal protein S18 acetylase RimI-like enzyme
MLKQVQHDNEDKNMAPNGLIIRKIREADIEAVFKIVKTTKKLELHKGDNWFSKNQVKRWIDDSRTVALLAEVDGTVAGFFFATYEPARAIGFLEEIAIDPEYQRQGIGQTLFDSVIRTLKGKGIGHFLALIQEDNKEMAGFLKKNGFGKGGKFYRMEKETK